MVFKDFEFSRVYGILPAAPKPRVSDMVRSGEVKKFFLHFCTRETLRTLNPSRKIFDLI